MNIMNWRGKEPRGLKYSGYVFVYKDSAMNKMKELKSWHVVHDGKFRWRYTKGSVHAVGHDGFAVFIGEVQGQLKVGGKWF